MAGRRLERGYLLTLIYKVITLRCKFGSKTLTSYHLPQEPGWNDLGWRFLFTKSANQPKERALTIHDLKQAYVWGLALKWWGCENEPVRIVHAVSPLTRARPQMPGCSQAALKSAWFPPEEDWSRKCRHKRWEIRFTLPSPEFLKIISVKWLNHLIFPPEFLVKWTSMRTMTFYKFIRDGLCVSGGGCCYMMIMISTSPSHGGSKLL